MTESADLDVDTDWIRRAAGTLSAVNSRLYYAQQSTLPTELNDASLGTGPHAATVAQLVNTRCRQSGEAAAALNSISTALAGNLVLAAEKFERAEIFLQHRIR